MKNTQTVIINQFIIIDNLYSLVTIHHSNLDLRGKVLHGADDGGVDDDDVAHHPKIQDQNS